MKRAGVFLMVLFLFLLLSGQGGRSTGAYEELKPEYGRVKLVRLVGSEEQALEDAARLEEIVRESGGVMEEIRLDELPAVLSCGTDRVKVGHLPWVLLVDGDGKIRYESSGGDLSELTARMKFLGQQSVTYIDESTWTKIKELFR
ncbi:MAG: hypothetical protein V1800_01885 [Candidatus Latescibacterota bacterium]